jgi:hypothetical protein
MFYKVDVRCSRQVGCVCYYACHRLVIINMNVIHTLACPSKEFIPAEESWEFK